MIRWDELGPQRYEDMVSVLVSRLHPDAQRIDGKGGDGGRDVQVVRGQDSQTTDAFELKSFTGRMTSGRRRQVEHSLKRAATIDPARWSLIVDTEPSSSAPCTAHGLRHQQVNLRPLASPVQPRLVL